MFFKDTVDLKKYVSVNASMSITEMTIFLGDVDRTITKKHLGTSFFNEIQAAYNASISTPTATAPNAKQAALIELLKSATANFAIAKWIPSGQLSIDSSGIRIANTETYKTAFQWQIKELERSVNEVGFNALEEALDYLEANIDDFTTYKNSNEFKENNVLFLRSSVEMSKYYSAFNNSRFNYLKIRSIIRKTEDFEIKSILLPDLYADYKTKLQNGETLGANAKALVELAKPAIAHLSIARAINELSASINPDGFLVFESVGSNNYDGKKQAGDSALTRVAYAAELDGQSYLKILKDYLETNKADYPLYTNDPKYVLPADETEINDDTKSFYSAV